MNAQIAIAYVAIGAMSKLITMQYPSPGAQWATVGEISIGALLAGWIGGMLPPGFEFWAVLFFTLPFVGDVAGHFAGRWIDRMRIRYYEKRAEHDDTEQGWPPSAGLESGNGYRPSPDDTATLGDASGSSRDAGQTRSTRLPQGNESGAADEQQGD